MSKPATGAWIVKDLLTNWRYFTGRAPVIPAVWVKGSCPLFLVLGENAGGKSFFRRCVQESAKKHTSIRETIHLSMEGRAGGMMGAVHGFVYGDEGWRSTGENSASTVSTAIKTCQGREHSHLLYWDEPDVGMSEGAAMGAGYAIAEFVAKLSDHTKGVFVTTHSRPMVAALSQGLRPHYVHLGTDPKEAPGNIELWLTRTVKPVSPDELAEASHARFKAIQKILDGKRRSR